MSPRMECNNTHTHRHTHFKEGDPKHTVHTVTTLSPSICPPPPPHTHTNALAHPLKPLSDHEQTNSTNSLRKNLQYCESNKENHGVRRTRTEPRNNKDLRLQPRTPQQCLRPALGFRLSHYKEEVLIIAICGRKQIVPCDYHFIRNVKV